MVYWVMRSLGTNVSETVLTKPHHRLVSHGPYRWVRHSLYAVATTAFFSLGLLAANAFLLAVAVLALAGIALLVIPAEEKELLLKFGDDYRRYMQRTGRLWPGSAAWSDLRALGKAPRGRVSTLPRCLRAWVPRL
jgi:protein-S-isoprenylcysteine O-methyltransferase Ste14